MDLRINISFYFIYYYANYRWGFIAIELSVLINGMFLISSLPLIRIICLIPFRSLNSLKDFQKLRFRWRQEDTNNKKKQELMMPFNCTQMVPKSL